jgi:hypothetical protein
VSRENWKDSVEIIGAVAIVVSLVFVGLEVRQNTNAVRSTVVQEVAQQSYDAIVLLIENDKLRMAQSAIDGAPPDEQRHLMYLYYAALIRIQLNRYMQARLGVIDADTVLTLGGSAGIYDRPSFREWWSPQREKFDPEFVAYMEERVFTD